MKAILFAIIMLSYKQFMKPEAPHPRPPLAPRHRLSDLGVGASEEIEKGSRIRKIRTL
ncbi:MAG: hypothetical protein AAF984_03420 [Verrucomicrobiota bacterium]